MAWLVTLSINKMAKIHLAHSYGSFEPSGGRAHNGVSYHPKSEHKVDLKTSKKREVAEKMAHSKRNRRFM